MAENRCHRLAWVVGVLAEIAKCYDFLLEQIQKKYQPPVMMRVMYARLLLPVNQSKFL